MRFRKTISKDSLIELANHRLGAGFHQIEISHEQYYDLLQQAWDYYSRYNSDGSFSSYLIHRITEEDKMKGYIDLSPEKTIDDEGDQMNVLSVVRVFPITDSVYSLSNIFSVKYQWWLNNCHDIASTSVTNYVMTMQHLRLLEDTFNGESPIRFNRHMHRLYVDTNWSYLQPGQMLIAEVYIEIDPDKYPEIWDDAWLKDYFVALCKRQWGMNLKKFSGVSVLGSTNITVNGQQIYDEAQAEIKDLEAKLVSEHYAPLQFFIG